MDFRIIYGSPKGTAFPNLNAVPSGLENKIQPDNPDLPSLDLGYEMATLRVFKCALCDFSLKKFNKFMSYSFQNCPSHLIQEESRIS